MASTTGTTAAELLKFRDELVSGGVPQQLADDMTRDASARIIQAHGLQVAAE